MRTGRSLQPIIDDYIAGGMSIKQIAAKHGVCIRTVYNAVKGKANRKGYARHNRRYLSLSLEEAQLIMDRLASPCASDGHYCLEITLSNRVRSIVDELSEINQ